MVRKLGSEEKALWGRVMATVKPLHPLKAVTKSAAETKLSAETKNKPAPKQAAIASKAQLIAALDTNIPVRQGTPKLTAPAPRPKPTLDGTWDRQISRGAIIPDVSVDLHGSGLASAYARLDGALEQAIAQKLRVVLLVTGHQRAHDRASGEGRGAIASVVRDWLAVSRHSSAIAAVRNAHPRHGGAGALYIVLKR
jgi:DNA-nicking Smr family endonuclease